MWKHQILLVTPVVLCGDSGARLWPSSHSGFPRQFLVFSSDDSNPSLFQQPITQINAIGNSQIDLSLTLLVTNEDQGITLLENQSMYIPQGQKDRLANSGKAPLEIIEVQSGSYLGEDNIVRFEDAYRRVN